MGQPGDRVRLARARRMLHEVASARAHPRARSPRGGAPRPTGGSGEDQLPLRSCAAASDPRRATCTNGRADRARRRAPRPPPRGSAVRWPVGIGRVALAAGVAAVEGQEARRRAGELGRHLHELGVDREVHERAPPEGHVRRVAVGAVLRLGVFDGLPGERVLELGRRDRDAVDEEAQVERLRRGGLVGELAGDGEAVGEVPLCEFRRQAVGGLEVGEADLDTVVGRPWRRTSTVPRWSSCFASRSAN